MLKFCAGLRRGLADDAPPDRATGMPKQAEQSPRDAGEGRFDPLAVVVCASGAIERVYRLSRGEPPLSEKGRLLPTLPRSGR